MAQCREMSLHLRTATDGCSVENGNCSYQCVPGYPRHYCTCPPGGQLDASNHTCVFNANCTELDGQVTCECSVGYRDASSNEILNCIGKITNVKYVADLTNSFSSLRH